MTRKNQHLAVEENVIEQDFRRQTFTLPEQVACMAQEIGSLCKPPFCVVADAWNLRPMLQSDMHLLCVTGHCT